MIASMIPKVLSMFEETPWIQMDEAYIVYVISIRSHMCHQCDPPHPNTLVKQSISVSFTLDVGRDMLINAPPIVAGVIMASNEDIRFLHTDTIMELVRQAHIMFTQKITPDAILSIMDDVYNLKGPGNEKLQ